MHVQQGFFWVRMRVFWRFGDGGEPPKAPEDWRNPQVHGPNARQTFESGAEDARTPNAVARSSDSASAKRLERVRFIGAFRPAPRLRGSSWPLCRAVEARRLFP